MDVEHKNQSQAAEDKAAKTGGDIVVRDKSGKKAIILAAIGVALVLLAVIIIALNVFGDSDRKL